MAIPSSGNISIKSAAGSGRSIDTEVASVSSGSLVTLSTNAVTYNNVKTAPYGMLEFRGYTHTQTQSVSESFLGRNSSQSYQMGEIKEYDYFGQGASFISTSGDLRFYYYYSSGPGTYNVACYTRVNFGGTSTNRKYRNSSNSITYMNQSTWVNFANISSPHSWDSMTLINSASTSTSGSGGFGSGNTTYGNGPYGSNNVNPPNSATSIALNTNYGIDFTYATEAECSDFTANRTFTQNLRLHKTGYYDWNSTSWKWVLSNIHDQSGMC